MISIAIVEDEDSCAKQMEEYLARYAEESGEVWRLGRRVAVEVTGTNAARGQIDLALVGGGRPRGTSRRADMRAR